jgi:hypothetical protein
MTGRMKEYVNDLDEQDDVRDLNEITSDDDKTILDSIKE